MRKNLATAFVIAATLALIAGSALAAGSRTSSLKTVTVVMHDPGCHWFAVKGKFLKQLSVKGPISLVNYDIAALKIGSRSGLKLDRVGARITLSHGSYRITMVGQAPDDNTLTLVVR